MSLTTRVLMWYSSDIPSKSLGQLNPPARGNKDMKKCKSKTDKLLALELIELNERVKEDSKRVDELKTYFKAKIELGAMEFGDVLITVDKRTTESVDKKALVSALGDKAKEFMRQSVAKVLVARRIA